MIKISHLFLIAATLLLFTSGNLLYAQKETNRESLEQTFINMLTDATLKGNWMPVKQGAVGDKQADSYHIVRVEKIKDERWNIISRIQHKGQSVDFPIPAVVKWAGDTAVLILDAVPVGQGKTWSARVLFHNNVYAGSWWAENGHGGVVSGTITQGDG